jgi:Tetracyclin repressor-like, C-terminal domain
MTEALNRQSRRRETTRAKLLDAARPGSPVGGSTAWGWLLVRLDVPHNVMHAALGPYARRDLRAGVRFGRLSVRMNGLRCRPGAVHIRQIITGLHGVAKKARHR